MFLFFYRNSQVDFIKRIIYVTYPVKGDESTLYDYDWDDWMAAISMELAIGDYIYDVQGIPTPLISF